MVPKKVVRAARALARTVSRNFEMSDGAEESGKGGNGIVAQLEMSEGGAKADGCEGGGKGGKELGKGIVEGARERVWVARVARVQAQELRLLDWVSATMLRVGTACGSWPTSTHGLARSI